LIPASLANWPSGRTPLARVACFWRGRRLGRQYAVPIELDIRVLLFERPDGVLIEGGAANLDVRRRPEPIKQLGLIGA
jgi:hypothetical protein